MAIRTHRYELSLTWLGNRGSGTSGYRDYDRAHVVSGPGKPSIAGSSDPHFRGDAERWNPEELLVAALSQCHMLWYLHLASVAGVVVTDYTDTPTGTMIEEPDGAGQFAEATLRPVVTVSTQEMAERANSLHAEAEENCFIARSVNFPVRCEPTVVVRSKAADGVRTDATDTRGSR